MSEVIVRMEMPLSCAVCRCHADGWCYLLSIQPSECTYDSRPSWCPIVGELPEQHGDLIDRNAFMKTIRPIEPIDESNFCSIETVKRIMVNRLSQAVILIPATKGKTEC